MKTTSRNHNTSVQFVALTPPGLSDPSIAIAASKAGHTGVLDLEFASDEIDSAVRAMQAMSTRAGASCGIKLNALDEQFIANIAGNIPQNISIIVLTYTQPERLKNYIEEFHKQNRQVVLEVTSSEQAAAGHAAGVDILLAKGNEAGGFVGEKTSFVLLQQIRAQTSLPVWVQGGIGIHTAAACYAAGAQGLVLDFQLALTRESSLPAEVKNHIRLLDGPDTLCIGDKALQFRFCKRPGFASDDPLTRISGMITKQALSHDAARKAWRDSVIKRIVWNPQKTSLWPLGQDAGFAVSFAKHGSTVGSIFKALRTSINRHLTAAKAKDIFCEGAPLAQAHGTAFPLVQGPMARISDNAPFAGRVAEGGSLPFIALSLMKPAEISKVLGEVKERLGARPWGIGLLGFNEPGFLDSQIKAAVPFSPRFAIIAGGMPNQVSSLEAQGIRTYVHVPSPALLDMFIDEGARNFVFEGNECGGHIGPRTSFVLWETMIERLLEKIRSGHDPADFHILFAGGIHDGLSAAMVASMASLLSEQGAKVGAVMGTAYLFTNEIVETAAIAKRYQENALACAETCVLEMSPGHALRCCDTPFAKNFSELKTQMRAQKLPPQETSHVLEKLILGRARIAAKATQKNPAFGSNPAEPYLIPAPEPKQQEEGLYMIGQLASLQEKTFSIQELHQSVSAGCSASLGRMSLIPEEAEAPRGKAVDIAIIGMGCVFPKAGNLREYWNNILHKVNVITEVPQNRWNWQLYFDQDKNARDKIYSRWGGFLEDMPFNPMKFGIPPNSLNSIEPLHLMALEVVSAALKDAGYENREFSRDKASVIFGTGGGVGDTGQKYILRATLPQLFDIRSDKVMNRLHEWTEDSFPGILMNVLAGRVANRFDLGGVNYTIDAACASSLAAVYDAVKELETGSSDMVIAGGADASQNAFTFTCFSKTNALSASGQCKVFDEKADGTVISEGVAVLVLKRLCDAERDGDRIYAVLKSVAGSSDGRGMGLTAPKVEGQMSAMRRAYLKAEISPASVELFEAHGTGTIVGDQVEAESATRMLKEHGARPQSCAIGSVKSMIGHTKGAAGLAGLIKVVFSLYFNVLPPTMGVTKPNRKIDFEDGPLYVNTELRPWIGTEGHLRRGAVSAFGFGGSNFHAVVQQYSDGFAEQDKPAVLDRWQSELFLWSGRSREEMIAAVESLHNDLSKGKPDLRDISFTVNKSYMERSDDKKDSPFNLAVVASSVDDLREKLSVARDALKQGAGRISDASGIYFSAEQTSQTGKVALLFPGQGSQYPGMLNELAVLFPEVSCCFERANTTLINKFPERITSYIFPPPCFTPEQEKQQMLALSKTNIAQPAIGAASYAMLSLLRKLGISFDMAAGHSYGEYVALSAAGTFDEPTLYTVSEARGRLMIEAASGQDLGVMAAVKGSAAEVRELIKNIDGVVIANINSPRQTVISGGATAIEKAVETCKSKGLSAQAIPVLGAFHSPYVSPAQKRFAEFLKTIPFSSPQCTVFSNTYAAPYSGAQNEIRDCLSEHMARPVEFMREIEAMYEAGARVFIEVGPGSVLTNLTTQILEGSQFLAVATNRHGQPGLTQLLKTLGQLIVNRVPVSLERLYAGRNVRFLDLRNLDKGDHEKPAATWLVSGAGIISPNTKHKPRAEEVGLETYTLRERRCVPRTPVNTAGKRSSEETFAPHVQRQERNQDRGSAGPVPDLKFAMTAGGEVEAVMQQFQQMMSHFLETQKAVMTSYLQGGTALLPDLPLPLETMKTEMPSPVGERTNREEIKAPAAEIREQEPAVIAPSVAPAVPVRQESGASDERFKKDLLRITGERTGYPSEMLGLDLDIEADLGIDSIKRVEIMSAFMKGLPQPEQERIRPHMDGLSRLRTLRAIIEKTVEAIHGSNGGPAVEAAAPASAGKSGLSDEHFKKELLRIAAERTGYPSEMLCLDLDIEADLGIDSIKRVEIMSAFMKGLPQPEQERIRPHMDGLSRLRTLRAIIEKTVEAIHGSNGGPAVEAAAPASAGKSGLSDEHFKKELLRIAGERTGYPSEMLCLDLDIEADLGIDSIKRVEIMSAFMKGLPQPEQERIRPHMDGLSRLRTLRAIIEKTVEAIHGSNGSTESQTKTSACCSAGAGPAPIQKTDTCHTVFVPRFVADTALSASPGQPLQIPRVGSFVITDDGGGIASSLARKIRDCGGNTVILKAGSGKAESEPGTYSIDLTNPAEVNSISQTIAERHAPIVGLIHLLPLGRSAQFSKMDLEQWRECLRKEMKSLYYLSRTLGRDLKKDKGWLLAATYSASVGQAGIAGFVKSLAQEWPEVKCRVLHLDVNNSSSVCLDQILKEMAGAEGPVEVEYRGSERLITKAKPAPLNTALREQIRIERDWVIMITGGAAGITAEAAKTLAEKYKPTLVLVGRSALPEGNEPADIAGLTAEKEIKAALITRLRNRSENPTPAKVEAAYARLQKDREIRQNIASMTQAGATVHYFQTDVRNKKEFSDVIENVYHTFGRLDGVIHGAGTIEDKLVENKTPESFDRVFDTKVDSAFILSRTLRPESLKFIVFFASVAGFFGNRGQSDYAAANEVVNQLAGHLDRTWNARVVAVNWGPWKKFGMVTPEVERQFRERGVQIIPPDSGCRLLDEELRFGSKGVFEVVIGDGPWEEHSKQSGIPESAALPLFSNGSHELQKQENGSLQLLKRLDPLKDVYLQDHRLDGKPVLPAAMAIELMAEAVKFGWPLYHISLVKNARLLKGIVLDGEAKEIMIRATETAAGENGDRAEIEVVIADAKQPRKLFYRSIVIASKQRPEPRRDSRFDHPAMQGFPLTADQAYQEWLFHGPKFQCITSIEGISDKGMMATIAPSVPAECVQGAAGAVWMIDPIVLDSGPQLAILWARANKGITVIPSGFRAVHLFGPYDTSPVRCHFEIIEASDQAVLANVSFFGPDGHLLCMVEGLESTGSKSLNRFAEKGIATVGE